MSSQMFWLLSYVSLGLALTLGNRPTGIHASSSSSSSSQQQKQQSTSSTSGQTQKSRHEGRLTREETMTSNGADETIVELDNLGNYRYNEPVERETTSDWWQDESSFPRRRRRRRQQQQQQQQQQQEQQQQQQQRQIDGRTTDESANETNDERTRREIGDDNFFDEFATVLLDTHYPRDRRFVPVKRKNYDNPGLVGRSTKKIKATTTRDDNESYERKISITPYVIYRPEQSLITFSKPEKYFNSRTKAPYLNWQRVPFDGRLVEQRNSARLSNEVLPTVSYEDNEIDAPSIVRENGIGDESEEIFRAGGKSPDKRNQGGGRGRNVNPRGWTSNGQQSQNPSATNVPGAGLASQFMLRPPRGNRQYDVPQIECPASEDGMERFACPTPDRMGRYRCIDDHVLCDGFIDCPTAEDEDRQSCMFYKTTKAHLDVLADALLRWARGR